MGSTIKSFILKISKNFEQLETIHSKYLKSLNNGSMGSTQSLKIQLLNMKGRILHQLKNLSSKIQGEIIEVDLVVDDIEDKGIFVNLSEEDIRDIYKLISMSTGKTIKIKGFKVNKTKVFYKS